MLRRAPVRVVSRRRTTQVTQIVGEDQQYPCFVRGCGQCFSAENALPQGRPVFIIDASVIQNHFSWVTATTLPIIVPETALQDLIPQRRLTLVANIKYHFRDTNRQSTQIVRNPQLSPAEYSLLASTRVAHWYSDHIRGLESAPSEIVLVTCMEQENEMPFRVMTPREVATEYCPDELRFVDVAARDHYEPHLSPEEAEAAVTAADQALRDGIEPQFVHGVFRARTVPFVGEVAGGLDRPVRLIGRIAVNRALDGDQVLVRLDAQPVQEQEEDIAIGEQTSTQRTGTVVAILRRATRQIVGSPELPYAPWHERPADLDLNSGRCLFRPFGPNFPRFRLLVSGNLSAVAGKRCIAEFTDWPESSYYPQCVLRHVVGAIGDADVEAKVILHHCQVRDHPLNVARYLRELCFVNPDTPQSDGDVELDHRRWSPTSEDRRLRRDLTDRPICSIDPPGCKDIDDAVHWMALGNGMAEVGVHIADVSAFVRAGGEIDREASYRCTTNYLADRRIDMLPKLLTEQLCSLVEDQERLAFSCLWVVDDKTFEIKQGPTFCRSIIRSRKSYEYSKAQTDILDERKQDPVTVSCRRLQMFARHLRRQRLENGALELASAAVSFTKVEIPEKPRASALPDQPATRVVIKEVSEYPFVETMSTIEEMMLLANVAAATTVAEAFPDLALLRCHPPPQAHAFDLLAARLAVIGVKLDFASNKALSQSLNALSTAIDTRTGKPYTPQVIKIIKTEVTRAMCRAQYVIAGTESATGLAHYGLALDMYTHFTSPIRRYADIIVHRQIQAVLSQRARHLAEEALKTEIERRKAEAENRGADASVVARMTAAGFTAPDGAGTGQCEHIGRDDGDEVPKTVAELTQLCKNMNERTEAQQRVGRFSTATAVALLFRDNGTTVERGQVVRIGKHGVTVSVLRIGSDISVPVPDIRVEESSDGVAGGEAQWTHPSGSTVRVRLFDPITIRVGYDWQSFSSVQLVACPTGDYAIAGVDEKRVVPDAPEQWQELYSEEIQQAMPATRIEENVIEAPGIDR